MAGSAPGPASPRRLPGTGHLAGAHGRFVHRKKIGRREEEAVNTFIATDAIIRSASIECGPHPLPVRHAIHSQPTNAVMPTKPSPHALDEASIFEAVQEMYEDVAVTPTKEFHFPTGRPSCLYLGYPESELDALPDRAVESFAGVGYPFLADGIESGDTVVDVGSGSGVDALIAALRAGSEGRVYGVDMTKAMIEKAEKTVREAGVDVVELLEGRADALPLDDQSADVLTSNGVYNLVPDKERAFREAYRVLRPGGRLQIADIALSESVSETSKANPELWAECIVGAEPEEVYLDLVESAGFDDVAVIDRLDYFARSSDESTRQVAKSLGAHTIVFTGTKS